MADFVHTINHGIALDTDGAPLPPVDVSVSADSSRHVIGVHLITRNVTIEVETSVEEAGVLRDMLDDVIGDVGGVSHLAEVQVLRESEALEVGLLKGRVAELNWQDWVELVLYVACAAAVAAFGIAFVMFLDVVGQAAMEGRIR